MNTHSTPEYLPSTLPKPPKSKRSLVVKGAAGLAVAAAVSGAVAWSNQHPAEETAHHALPAPDVPRVDGDAITFSEAFATRAGIRMTPVQSHSFQPTIQAVGNTDFDPNGVAVVGARLRGMVSHVEKFEGDTVTKGALLATIESPELAEAQATVQHYLAEKDAAELNAKRETELAARNLSTARESELAKVELRKFDAMLGAAQQRVRALAGAGHGSALGSQELRSPIAGTVVESFVNTGQSVESNYAAFKIADLDRLWVDVKIFDQSVPLIRIGDRVELRPLTLGREGIDGRVSRLGATIDPETRSISVRVEIDNRSRKLRAGQSVTAVIHSTGRGDEAATLIPSSAVTYVDGQPTVFVGISKTRVQVRRVRLGQTSEKLVQIEEGVQSGEQVVAEGAFALKSELFR